jgi:hypothetical protein
MRSKFWKLINWKSSFLAIIALLILSNSILAEVKVCNRTGKPMRVARVTIKGSGYFSLDCILDRSKCNSQIHNFSRIGEDYCASYYTGNFRWLYMAVQTQNKDGSWSSPIYKENEDVLINGYVRAGSSGFSGTSVCIRDNHYSMIYDRKIKGTLKAVNAETCKTGYSKVPINLFAQDESDTNLTVDLN